MPEVSSPTTKVMDENKDVPNDSKDGNEGSKTQDGEDVDVLNSPGTDSEFGVNQPMSNWKD